MWGLKIAVGLTTVNGYAEWFSKEAFLILFYLSLVWVSVFVRLVPRTVGLRHTRAIFQEARPHARN